MSGLADYEKQGLFDLFNSQDDKEILMQLARIITKNSMDFQRPEEALDVIFLHGGSTATILNKKILTKEIIFKYLHKNSIRVTSDFTKISLVEQTQKFWKEKFSERSRSHNNSRVVIQSIESRPNLDYIDQPNAESFSQQQQEQMDIIQQNNQISSSAIVSPSYPINLLANKFSEWFFKSYNENTIKIEDFWSDSILHFKMIETTTSNIQEHQCDTNVTTKELLLRMKMNFNLIFNPNLAYEGVQGRLDPHGLVLVLCCGTLHTVDKCIGIFESVFGLIRDPNTDNNWKIKTMKLILKSSIMQQIPNLCESDTLSGMLSLPEPSGNI